MAPQQRRRFLDELAVTGNVSYACERAECTRLEAYQDREELLWFEKEWRNAERRAHNLLLQRFR